MSADDAQFKAVIAPMLIAAVGIILSILGIFAVRTKENASMKTLLRSLSLGTNLSSVLIAGASFLILWLLGMPNWLNIAIAVVVGLVVGVVIGQATEYFTYRNPTAPRGGLPKAEKRDRPQSLPPESGWA